MVYQRTAASNSGDTFGGLLPSVFDSGEFPQTWWFTPGWTFRLRGRVDTDSIWTTQSAANTATFDDLGNVVGLRRARIGGEGDLGEVGRYITEIDLAPGIVVPRDVFVGFGDVNDFGERRIGHFREPFSLEGATSANSFAFMERSTVNMLDPARNWGLCYFRADVNTSSTLALGAFHAGTDAGDFQGGDGSTVGFTEKLTTAPINVNNGEQLLHFGIALSERVPENGVITINQQPRNPLLDFGDSSTSPFVPVIRVPATFQQLVNLQVAMANGPFWTQAEWYASYIEQRDAGDVLLHGCHADCGYFVTGEHREYLSSAGAFGAVKVNRPLLRGTASFDRARDWGAWELTTRFAYLDFFDPDTPLGPAGQLEGIQLATATFGVNWYLADHVRLLFNYTYEVPVEPNTGSSVASIFGIRLNVFW
jgi:phosphate-selective porin OprO/OprP